jgi:hypothetical protein
VLGCIGGYQHPTHKTLRAWELGVSEHTSGQFEQLSVSMGYRLCADNFTFSFQRISTGLTSARSSFLSTLSTLAAQSQNFYRSVVLFHSLYPSRFIKCFDCRTQINHFCERGNGRVHYARTQSRFKFNDTIPEVLHDFICFA